MTQFELQITSDTKVTGTNPVVIIGPNGVGKTRFGAKLASSNSASWISAERNLQIDDNIPMANTEQARNEVINLSRNSMAQPWTLAREATWLISKLMAEDSKSAVEYRNVAFKAPGEPPKRTKIILLSEFWHQIFPQRRIDLFSYKPTAVSQTGASASPYPLGQMSDGERVALYLAAKVLDAPPGLIVVDEPEVHFHSLLAKQFWNGLEKIRLDCRFIYITHDLPFALSRKSAEFVIIRKGGIPQLLGSNGGIPAEVVEEILGAASFSVAARRIVFVEGTTSIDQLLYEAWFNDPDTAVVAVGSCDAVSKCVEVFNSKAILGANAIGIMDRDYWPETYFSGLPKGVHLLPVHEVENLFCLEGVFRAVARYLRMPDDQVLGKYNEFIAAGRNYFKKAVYNKQVLERAKREFELNAFSLLNRVSTNDDFALVEAAFLQAVDPTQRRATGADFLRRAGDTVRNAMEGDSSGFVSFFPGKSIISLAAQQLGITFERLVELVTAALSETGSSPADPKFGPLGRELSDALASYLPPRTVPSEQGGQAGTATISAGTAV